MWSKRIKLTHVMIALAMMAVLVSLACSGETAATATPVPAAATATKVPAAATATTVPAAATATAAPAAPTATAKPAAATATPVALKWTPAKVDPGSIWTGENYTGPAPTTFHESPLAADLVKQGKILPLAQRLPIPADVRVFNPSDEIGTYGGVLRITASAALSISSVGGTNGSMDLTPDGIMLLPGFFKSFTVSSDARTFTWQIRQGLRWSDGYPYTIEDVRFAFEDLMLNKELMPGLPPELISPISGKDVKFKVVDDHTFQLTFDDPNPVMAESSAVQVYSYTKGCPRCFTSPSHVQKRFHIKYNAAEIPALLTKYNQPDWVKLFTYIRNADLADVGQPSVPVPTTFDINYIYKGDIFTPWTGSWILKSKTPSQQIFERNYYFSGVDPEGNQLPYLDGVNNIVMESRDVAIFRMMAGETDFTRSDVTIAELPLYVSNMVKGDYSIMKYPDLGGADQIWGIGQEYKDDAEIGKLMRTYDFRLMLSKVWDRKAANESFAAGLGVPQQADPHPSTPYAAEDSYRYTEVAQDIAGAKALLTKMGYKDTDGDGFVNRLDGKGNLELYYGAYNLAVYPFFGYVQLLQSDMKKVGIKMNISETPPGGYTVDPQTDYFYLFSTTEGSINLWGSGNQRLLPTAVHTGWPAVGTYFATRGEKGMAPTGPDAKWTDIYGKMAPAGTYPVDISGAAKKLQDNYVQGQTLAMLDPKRIELGKDFFRINITNMLKPNGLAYTGIMRSLRVKRNNLRNVPRNGTTGTSPSNVTFTFEGGIDNINHPGNKSKIYKSVSFVDPSFWNPVFGQ